jgi:two-component system chemotaxis sensor kinase CheA
MQATLRKPPVREFELARVLLVDDDLTSRLTLKAVLEAGGYFVDSAASAAEAVGKLDERQYELVLSDLQMESPHAGLKVIAHARLMKYKPATAILTTHQNTGFDLGRRVLIEPEDLPNLLSKVADLISQRAARIVARQMKQAGTAAQLRARPIFSITTS